MATKSEHRDGDPNLAAAMAQLNLSSPLLTNKQRKAEARKIQRAANIAAVQVYFAETYDSNTDELAALQTLCKDLGVEEGRSKTQCKKILDGVYVNIVDFVRVKQLEKDQHPGKVGDGTSFGTQSILRFESLSQLRKYSRAQNKIFPLEEAKVDSVLRALLVPMFGSRGRKA